MTTRAPAVLKIGASQSPGPGFRAEISFFVVPEKERRIRRPMCFIFNIGKTVLAKTTSSTEPQYIEISDQHAKHHQSWLWYLGMDKPNISSK